MGPSDLLEHVISTMKQSATPSVDQGNSTLSTRRPASRSTSSSAAPEDVIIKKMEYFREGGSEKHLRDITGILLTTGADVDRLYIERWAQQLGLSEIWKAIVKRLEGFRERGKEDMVLKCRPIRDRVVNITTVEEWL